MLSCSEDSSIRLWNLSTRTTVCAYRSSAESLHPLWDVACAPLGYYFASASHDRTAALWSPERVSPLRRFVGHLSDVETVAFHPNGTMVATGSLDRTVRMWDVRQGQAVRVLTGHRGRVSSLAFSPNGQFLVSGGKDAQLFVWDIPAGKQHTTLPWSGRGTAAASHSEVRALSYSADGTVLASATTDRRVRLWDAVLFQAGSGDGKDRGGGDDSSDIDDSDAGSNNGAPAVGLGYRNDMLTALPTRATDVLGLRFTERNLLIAAGPARSAAAATGSKQMTVTAPSVAGAAN